MTAICNICGEEWSRDPALEVECPECRAKVGRRCRRPSGHTGPFVEFHADRDRLALKLGFLKQCPGRHPEALPPPPTPRKKTAVVNNPKGQRSLWDLAKGA